MPFRCFQKGVCEDHRSSLGALNNKMMKILTVKYIIPSGKLPTEEHLTPLSNR